MTNFWKGIGLVLFLTVVQLEAWAGGFGFLPDGATDRIGFGRIQKVAYSPDAQFIAVATSIGIRIIETETNSQSAFFRQSSFINDLLFLNGDQITVATDDGLKILDLRDPRSQLPSPNETKNDPVSAIAISSNGEWLAVGVPNADHAGQSKVYVYTLGEDDTKLSQVFLAAGRVIDIEFNPAPNGLDQIIAFTTANEIHLWRKIGTESVYRNVQKIKMPNGISNRSLAFDSDGNHLIIGAFNTATLSSEIFRQTIDDLEPKFVKQIVDEEIFDLIFHPLQRNILAIGTDLKLRVWEVFASDATQKGSPLLDRDFSAGDLSLAFHPKTKTLVVGADNTPLGEPLTVFEIAGGKIANRTVVNLEGFNPKILALSSPLNPEKFQLAAHFDSRQTVIYDLTDRSELIRFPIPTRLNDLAFYPLGDEIAIAQQSHEVANFDLTQEPPKEDVKTNGTAHLEFEIAQAVAFDPTGTWIASIADKGSIRVRQRGGGTFELDVDFENVLLNDISINFDGTNFATVSNDGRIGVYNVDASDGITPVSIRSIGREGKKIAFSTVRNDNRFVVGLDNGSVQFWQITSSSSILRTHQISTITQPPYHAVEAIEISLDGRFVAAAVGSTVWVWNHATPNNNAKQFVGHTAKVTSISFLQLDDGTNLLASGSEDGTILIWDISAELGGFVEGKEAIMIEPSRKQDTPVTDQIRIRIPAFAKINETTLTTFNFRVEGKIENGSTVAYSHTPDQYKIEGANVILFDPRSAFREEETVTIHLSSAIEDINGKFAQGSTIEFKTGLIVWPGDTNTDGRVNIFDILPLGQFWGMRGDPRRKGGSAWKLQPAIAWKNKRATYADANGDGAINRDDIYTISDNWKKTNETFLRSSFAPPQNVLENDQLLSVYREIYSALRSRNLENGIESELEILLRQLIEQIELRYLPTVSRLLNNYPNPFNPETWLPYQLSQDGNVKITIYNVNGEQIRSLEIGQRSAGFYVDHARAAYWDGRNEIGENVASGIYIFQIDVTDQNGSKILSDQKRMVILK